MRMILTLALLGAFAGAGQAQTMLSQMEGAWTGSGWAKRTPNHPEERVRCRLTNTYDEAQAQMSVEGLCAVSGRQIPMAGTVRQVSAEGRLEGLWDDTVGSGRSAVEGKITETAVYIDIQAAAVGSGDDVSQTLQWTFAEGGMVLQSTLLEDPSIVMSEITFE